MRHVKIAVIGGGITGRLVQFLIPDAQIFDWKPSFQKLTRHYGANYLWQPLDGIPCRKFEVVTHVDGASATLHKVNKYKNKIGKSGDVEGWERQFSPHMMGFDILELPQAHIQYNHRIVAINRFHHVMTFDGPEAVMYETLISTIPLYSLLSLADIDEPVGRLRFKPIYIKVGPRPPDAPLPIDTLYVNYISNPDIVPYRFCDRFGERHYESIVPFPGPPTKRFTPGKIYPHPAVPDVLATLAGFDIYTFGRYGSWSHDELVHETYDQIAAWREAKAL